jgi:3-hydroxyisobutyrate dehydrogenase-like beta-hydroxyacid dehydrogenase
MFQNVSQALVGDLERGKFELDNARKDIRYYTHMAESVSVPCPHGDAVLSGLALASALGHGKKFVNALVLAQEQINGIKIVGEKA